MADGNPLPAQPTTLDAVLADVLRRSRVGVVLLSVSGRVRWSNPAAQAMLGGSSDAALVDRPLRSFFAADTAQLAMLARLEARLADPQAEAERGPLPGLELRRADDRRWLRLDLQTQPAARHTALGLGGALAISDVTDQRRAREDAGREGTLLREAAHLGQVGAWDLDPRANRVRWSDETFAIHDLPVGPAPQPEQAIEYCDVASRPLLRAAIEQAVQQGKPFDLSVGLVSACGRHKRVRVIGSAERDETGRVVRVAGLLHDITERERHAQALLEKAAAERDSRTKSELFSRMSHELRTPLNAVLGYAQLLEQRAAELPAWAVQPLRLVRASGDELLRLIESMLAQGPDGGVPGAAWPAAPGEAAVARVAAPQPTPPQPTPPPPRSAATACDVLYIEDHPVNALLVREALAVQQPRHRLRVADTGERGLAMVAEQRPDIVLLDLNLPGMDGYEVLARLRADPSTAGVPCVAVSADAMPEELARARVAGFDDYWTKPLTMAGLAERIGAIVPAAPKRR